MSYKLAVLALTRNEAQIWRDGLESETRPETVLPPKENTYHHFHKAHRLGRRDKGISDPEYFEEVAQLLKGYGRILLIGHGKSKANTSLQMMEFLKQTHADQASKVVNSLIVDIENLSENEILATARKWLSAHPL